ncbi:MAG: hypothetical protein AAF267_15090 [Deinococcota bacterium]
MKHYRRSFSLLLLLIVVLAGCSQRIPDITDPKRVEIPSAQGGTVTIEGSQGQASFFFPPGVLTEDTTIDAGIFNDPLPPAPSGIVLIDPSYFIGPRCLVQGQRITPGGEVTISLPYTDAAVPSGFLESNLTILFFDKLNEAWIEVPNTTVNQTFNTVQGSFGEMCVFTVGAKPDTGDFFNIDFNAIPTTIVEGADTELSWEVTSRTGNNIQTITLLEGRNGDGDVIEVFDDLNNTTVTGTADIIGLTETTEYTLRVTDGTNEQSARITVNVLPEVVIEFEGSGDSFEYPVPQVNLEETATFRVVEGVLNYTLEVDDPDVISINEEDLTGTVGEGETQDVDFTVTCLEPVSTQIQISSGIFGVVDTIRVSCFDPPGTLRITANFTDATLPVNAFAVVRGSDNSVNEQVSLSSAAPIELSVPSGNYTVSFPNITDANGVTYSPNAATSAPFVAPDQTVDIGVTYIRVPTP